MRFTRLIRDAVGAVGGIEVDFCNFIYTFEFRRKTRSNFFTRLTIGAVRRRVLYSLNFMSTYARLHLLDGNARSKAHFQVEEEMGGRVVIVTQGKLVADACLATRPADDISLTDVLSSAVSMDQTLWIGTVVVASVSINRISVVAFFCSINDSVSAWTC